MGLRDQQLCGQLQLLKIVSTSHIFQMKIFYNATVISHLEGLQTSQVDCIPQFEALVLHLNLVQFDNQYVNTSLVQHQKLVFYLLSMKYLSSTRSRMSWRMQTSRRNPPPMMKRLLSLFIIYICWNLRYMLYISEHLWVFA